MLITTPSIDIKRNMFLTAAFHESYDMLVRMAPSDSIQSQALVDLVKHYGWSNIAILTASTDHGKIRFTHKCIHLPY